MTGPDANVSAVFDDLETGLLSLLGRYRRRLQSVAWDYKEDGTLLTEADLAVQDFIVGRVTAGGGNRRRDAIIAEEKTACEVDPSSWPDLRGRVWVVDPIDGTREFLKPDATEFCAAVCVLEDLRPTAALIVAPELGPDRTPVVVRVDEPGAAVTVNGVPARSPEKNTMGIVSATRSSGTVGRPWENALRTLGCTVETHTRSQTLDILRTCVAIPGIAPFQLFLREHQKIWDGAPGMCIALASGISVADLSGHPLVPFPIELLMTEAPELPAAVIGDLRLLEAVPLPTDG
ncbi:inositol monophosphatase family protein [Streptomyces sp. CA-135486]|uniref:inositol monophosphatase family protein n=1 Tax=Streptomyces sp. CA-135486 TaxID=3240049 RepID=UPI003D8AC954